MTQKLVQVIYSKGLPSNDEGKDNEDGDIEMKTDNNDDFEYDDKNNFDVDNNKIKKKK